MKMIVKKFLNNGPEILLRSLEASPMLTEESFGHSGAGGSLAFGDLDHQVGFGYVMNQMGTSVMGDPRTASLIEAIRSCL